MGKSRHRKDHKKKVQARNNRIQQEKRRIENIKRNIIMNLINEEKEKGLFENTISISTDTQNPIIEGPTI
jgi:hypothetical protein